MPGKQGQVRKKFFVYLLLSRYEEQGNKLFRKQGLHLAVFIYLYTRQSFQ